MDLKTSVEKAISENIFNQVKNRIKGKTCILYGEPFVGKSIFSLNLSKYFKNSTLLLIDRNYIDEYFSINPSIKVLKVNSPKQLEYYISKEIEQKEDQIVIVDSITSLAPFFIKETYATPREMKSFSDFVDKVVRNLSYLKPTTSLIVTHEKIKSFESKEIVPRINMIALRHCDVVLRMWIEDSERKVAVVRERKMPENFDFSFFG